MAGADPVRLTTTMVPFETLLADLRSPRPWPDPHGPPPELPASAWQRLFLVALQRMAAHGKQNLAHLTAGEASALLYSWTAPESQRAKAIEEALTAMESRVIAPKDLTAREVPGDFLELLINSGKRNLVNPLSREAAEKLWRRCGGQGLPSDLWERLLLESSPLARATLLVASALQIKPESVPVILSRYRKKIASD